MNKLASSSFTLALMVIPLATILAIEELPLTVFAIGKYANRKTDVVYNNNLNINRKLMISRAEALEITVEGETEDGYDFIIIHDQNKNRVRRLSGMINEKLVVKGDTIYVNFVSDGRTTKDGIVLKIASSSLFSELKSRLTDVTLSVLKEGTGAVYKNLSHQLERFKQLQILAQTQPVDRIAAQTITELLAVAQAYRQIAAQEETIMNLHQAKLKQLDSLKTETLANLEQVKQEQNKYYKLLSETQAQLHKNQSNVVDQQKEQLSIPVYKRILAKLIQQQDNWEALSRYQEQLTLQLQDYSKAVSLLLYFLRINADLYEQTTTVALMQTAQIVELNELTDLSELQKIITRISSKEQDLKTLLEKIQNINFETKETKTN